MNYSEPILCMAKAGPPSTVPSTGHRSCVRGQGRGRSKQCLWSIPPQPLGVEVTVQPGPNHGMKPPGRMRDLSFCGWRGGTHTYGTHGAGPKVFCTTTSFTWATVTL